MATAVVDTPVRPGLRDYDERSASLSPPGTKPHIRPPPAPHLLTSPLTPDPSLFQTIHFAPAPTVDLENYRLIITGLVSNHLLLTLSAIKALPSTTLTAFHECYGPPTLPPDTNRWRVGCVRWTGVRLSHLLSLAKIDPEVLEYGGGYVWSDGLDKGTFQGTFSDRYRKDLPMKKALRDEVLVAYAMNGTSLSELPAERGGPVKLVVPGWFGTNSTKWLCRLEVRHERAEGEFVGRFYSEEVPEEDLGRRGRWDGNVLWEREGRVMRPVWRVQVNSMIVRPRPGEVLMTEEGEEETEVQIEGWAWSDEGVKDVEISVDNGKTWEGTELEVRKEYSWQKFKLKVRLKQGEWKMIARAECWSGLKQPLKGRRNHVHSVTFEVD